jgi:hypothetical protein
VQEPDVTRPSTEAAWPEQATDYVFPDVSMLHLGDQVVAARLQRDAGVIVSPGYQLGPAGTVTSGCASPEMKPSGTKRWTSCVEVLLTLGREQGL